MARWRTHLALSGAILALWAPTNGCGGRSNLVAEGGGEPDIAGACVNGAQCDDGDACTTGDSCASGVCRGTPVTCTTPPPAVCVSSSTLRTFSPPGTCGAAGCSYVSVDETCPSGCSGGACQAATQPTAIAVAAGGGHTCAVVAGGAVRCWGANLYGQLGDGSTSDSLVPVPVTGLSSGVKDVSAGAAHTCGVASAGAVMCWGYNSRGQLGDDSTAKSVVPVPAAGLSSGVVAISASLVGAVSSTCALTSASSVLCWGDDSAGQLGDDSTIESHVPVPAMALSSGVVAVSAGVLHTCAVVSAGAVMCWGDNSAGQLGNDSTDASHVPVPVTGLSSGVVAVSGGQLHTCALTSGGAVLCWGDGTHGQLGDGSTTERHVAGPVAGLSSGVVAISAGGAHTCGITSGGAVVCWGQNSQGQLGNDSTVDSAVPVPVVGLSSGVVALSAGESHSCAVTSAGRVMCWGGNAEGQLGNGSTIDSHVPVEVSGF